MVANNKREVEKYFNPPSKPSSDYIRRSLSFHLVVGAIFSILGLIFLFSGFSEMRGVALFVLIGGFIFLGYSFYLRKQDNEALEKQANDIYAYESEIDSMLSDNQLDSIASSSISKSKILQMALSKLGLDEDNVKEIAPIYLSGYYFLNISGILPEVKKGEDGRWRSSFYESSVLLFSETQVYSYNYRVGLIKDIKSEKTDEYFYKDIVSASTDSKEITVEAIKDTIYQESFILTTSGGTIISCSILHADETTQQSITAMKHLLRQKKLEK